jgi:hypothetical protein
VVLDQQGQVVAFLPNLSAQAVIVSISLSTQHFVPEQDRWLTVTTNGGATAGFNGVGNGGQALPNGYYHIQVRLSGGSVLDQPFYLEHQAWNGGTVAAMLPLHGDHALIAWNYSEAVNIKVGLYDLAGELVWVDHGVGMAGQIRWDLRTSSGRPVSSGIYLVKVDASSLDGSVEDVRMLKMAVLR